MGADAIRREPGDPVCHRHVTARALHGARRELVRGFRRAVEEVSGGEIRPRDRGFGRVEISSGGTPVQDLARARQPAGARMVPDRTDPFAHPGPCRGAAAAGRVVAIGGREPADPADPRLRNGGLLRPPAGFPLAAHRETVNPSRFGMVGVVAEPALQLVVARTVLGRVEIALRLHVPHQEPAAELLDFAVRRAPASLPSAGRRSAGIGPHRRSLMTLGRTPRSACAPRPSACV